MGSERYILCLPFFFFFKISTRIRLRPWRGPSARTGGKLTNKTQEKQNIRNNSMISHPSPPFAAHHTIRWRHSYYSFTLPRPTSRGNSEKNMYTWLTSFFPSPTLSTHTFRSRSCHDFHFLHSSPIFLVGLLKSQCMHSNTRCSPVPKSLFHHLQTSLSALPNTFLHDAKLPRLVLSCVYVDTVCLSHFVASRWPTQTLFSLLFPFSHCCRPPSVTWSLSSLTTHIFAISSALSFPSMPT